MLQVRVEAFSPKEIEEAIRKDVQRRRALMVGDAQGELKQTAPVDTGFFRANWIPCRDGSASSLAGSIAGIPPAKSVGDSSVQSARGVQGQGESVPLHDVPLSEDLVLFNNQVYGPALNEGSSSQAPSGFFQTAVERAVKKHAK